MSVKIQLRRDTATDWASANPTLSLGEPGVETDTLKIKIGDGATAWNSLDYTTTTIFSELQNIPTTLAGYGITDASTTTEMNNAISLAVSDLVDTAPGALDTLNELAAAINDDANFSTTITDSIATKLPLAGGTMTGDITFNAGQQFDGRDVSADGAKLDTIEENADVTDTANVTAAGALMDSEVTNLAQVKTFDGSDYATSAQGALADSALQSVAFADLTTTPTTLSGYGITDAATSAQGALADSALQSETDTLDTVLSRGATSDTGINVGASTISGLTITGTVLDSSDSSPISITPSVTFDTAITVSDVVPSANTAIDLGTSSLRYREVHSQTVNAVDPDQDGFAGDGRVRTNRLYLGDETHSAYIYNAGNTGSIGLFGTIYPQGSIFHNGNYYTRWKSTSQLVNNAPSNPSGTVDVDFYDSDTHYFYQPTGELTVNFINLPSDNNRMINMRILIVHGATPYIPNSVQVSGSPVTIEWQNGVVPTGQTSSWDLVQFLLWRIGDAWYCMAQSNNYS